MSNELYNKTKINENMHTTLFIQCAPLEFEASQSNIKIVDKLNQGINDAILDQGFSNDMLEEIAMAVGVLVEPSEISLHGLEMRVSDCLLHY